MPCHPSKAYCTCFWPATRQVHRSLSTLLEFQPIFVVFVANQRSSIVPPYAPQTNADARGNPLHPPHPTPRHRSYTRICLLSTHRRDTYHKYDIRIPICTMATDGSRLPHPKTSMLDLCCGEGNSCGRREAGRYVCCLCGVAWVVEVEGVSPCVSIRLGGI